MTAPATVKGLSTPRIASPAAAQGSPGPCGCGCALRPRTSLGFEAVAFAEDVLGVVLLGWQRWWLIHALEVDGDGGFRYRTVLTLVARQNGKTTLLKIVSLWMSFMGRARMILGSAQSLDIARESWQGAVELAQDTPELRDEIDAVRRTNGEQELRLTNGARYRIAASTRSAGRGLSVDLLILDELREHRDWGAWGALSKTTMARPNALTVAISNAGDDDSVVLNNLRASALAGTDPTVALFEWSAADDTPIDDRDGWAQANPGLGFTISPSAIASAMATDPPGTFRTEVLCQRVEQLDGAIDLGAWRACRDQSSSLESLRDRLAVCVDVSVDGAHVTMVGAAVTDGGTVVVEVLAAWPSTAAAKADIPGVLARLAPAHRGWLPSGPAAALAPVLRGDGVVEVKGAAAVEACMGLAELVASRQFRHPGDPLLDNHAAGAGKVSNGDGWRFTRRGAGHCDALYATAGAVHIARTVEVERPLPRSVVF